MIDDEVSLLPDGSSDTNSTDRLLIFYIAGNPGLIGYYKDFLLQLRWNLHQTDDFRDTIIYGASSDGFELHSPSKQSTAPPYGLEQQIEFTQQRLRDKVREFSTPNAHAKPVPVILVAHSVGAYILLETIAQWQAQKDEHALYHIVGGIGLFPTIVEIAQSAKGRQLSWLLRLPGIARVLQWLARGLVLVPVWLWNWPKALNPGPAHADVTEAMLRSRHGVRQVM